MKIYAGLYVGAIALLSLTGPAMAKDEVVNVYNWVEYGEDVVKQFEAETGIKVRYDNFSSNEELDAKLSAGKTGYDLVFPTASPFFARQIKADIYQPLNKELIPNLANLDPELMKQVATADPGNVHGAIYLWGTNGIGYNKALVEAALPDAPVDSLALIFDPEVVSNFKDCGVAILDSSSEVYPAVAKYLGLDPASEDKAVLDAVEAHLLKIRPFVRYFNSSQYINDLANGQICVAWGYAGDVFQASARASEANNGNEIMYSIPKEGTLLWFDIMGVPKDAPNADNAMKLINFILRPEIAAQLTNSVKYANAVPASVEKIDPEVKANPGIYPSPEVKANLFLQALKSPEYVREEARSWQKVKSGT